MGTMGLKELSEAAPKPLGLTGHGTDMLDVIMDDPTGRFEACPDVVRLRPLAPTAGRDTASEKRMRGGGARDATEERGSSEPSQNNHPAHNHRKVVHSPPNSSEEIWRCNIVQYLSTYPAGFEMPIAQLGAAVPRPLGLDSKLTWVMQGDNLGRLAVTGDRNQLRVTLSTSARPRSEGVPERRNEAGPQPFVCQSASTSQILSSIEKRVKAIEELRSMVAADYLSSQPARTARVLELESIVRIPSVLGPDPQIVAVLEEDCRGRFQILGQAPNDIVKVGGVPEPNAVGGQTQHLGPRSTPGRGSDEARGKGGRFQGDERVAADHLANAGVARTGTCRKGPENSQGRDGARTTSKEGRDGFRTSTVGEEVDGTVVPRRLTWNGDTI